MIGNAWRCGNLLAAQADGCGPDGPQGLDDLLDADAGAGLCFPRDRERSEHDGQVGLDAVADSVEYCQAARSDLAIRKDRSTW
jgi:hypothetical protein